MDSIKAMKEVTKEELYNYIGSKNVECCIVGECFPYTCIFRSKSMTREIIAKIIPSGKCYGISSDPYKYYILKE